MSHLLTFNIFIIFVHHICPEGMSLPVSAGFFTDSFPVFFLPVILELAVTAVLDVPACIVSRSRSRCPAWLMVLGLAPWLFCHHWNMTMSFSSFSMSSLSMMETSCMLLLSLCWVDVMSYILSSVMVVWLWSFWATICGSSQSSIHCWCHSAVLSPCSSRCCSSP